MRNDLHLHISVEWNVMLCWLKWYQWCGNQLSLRCLPQRDKAKRKSVAKFTVCNTAVGYTSINIDQYTMIFNKLLWSVEVKWIFFPSNRFGSPLETCYHSFHLNLFQSINVFRLVAYRLYMHLRSYILVLLYTVVYRFATLRERKISINQSLSK